MVRKKRNDAARDLWQQILSRLSAQENASIWDSNYDPSADEARASQGFLNAGWSTAHVESIRDQQRTLLANAPRTSPGINPGSEVFFDILCNDVESAMERLKIDSNEFVSRGIEPRLGPYASSTNVIMTNEGIITVGTHLFRFCGLVAKAFIRTLLLDLYFWETKFEISSAKKILAKNQNIARYWFSIFIMVITIVVTGEM
jgi:hypothetical protein